jgi:DNA-binding NtrC family response regulator
MLRAAEHTVVTADHLSSARDLLAEKAFDLLLIDLMLPDGNGLELLDGLGDRRPPRVIMITGHPAIKANIRHLHGPGLQYLTKPIDPQELMSIVAAEQATAQSHQNLHFGLIVGASEPMLELVEQFKQVGPSDVSVIITGESGTGKELVAQAVHRESRCSGPFVAVNCGGLTSELVASELFGHEKGSFTGANKRHLGSFERAEDGTLFLDEISEMPMDQQPHLLRAGPFRALAQPELHRISGIVRAADDDRTMKEDIIRVCGRADEPEALHRVEPLHHALQPGKR